jgi:uncharacterized protein (TIGR02466 family)
MKPQAHIVELFPKAVCASMLPTSLSSTVNYFNTVKMSEQSDHNNYGHRSDNTYVLDEPECKDLKDHILQMVTSYAYDVLFYDYDSWKFAQSWISIKMPGQQHVRHSHPNSMISGVFYYGEPADKTPAIRFHKSGGPSGASLVRPNMRQTQKGKYALEFHEFTYEPGLLLLFPSYLEHSVPVNKSDKPRFSLAFNCVPTVGFGNPNELTELKF